LNAPITALFVVQMVGVICLSSYIYAWSQILSPLRLLQA